MNKVLCSLRTCLLRLLEVLKRYYPMPIHNNSNVSAGQKEKERLTLETERIKNKMHVKFSFKKYTEAFFWL